MYISRMLNRLPTLKVVTDISFLYKKWDLFYDTSQIISVTKRDIVWAYEVFVLSKIVS